MNNTCIRFKRKCAHLKGYFEKGESKNFLGYCMLIRMKIPMDFVDDCNKYITLSEYMSKKDNEFRGL